MKTGILLLNIGTPKTATTQDVRSYLKRFLMDEDVISIPYILRWILVHFIILPFHAKSSAQKYQKIWTIEGSPLFVHMKNLSYKIQENLGPSYHVEHGLAYSAPEIDLAIQKLIDLSVNKIIVIPLFPQYAQATTGSIIKNVQRIFKNKNCSIPVEFIDRFYNEEFFIANTVKLIQKEIENKKIDHFLFSYHGLPVKQLKETTNCSLVGNCGTLPCAEKCYYNHCLNTTKTIAHRLNLNTNQLSMSFQSRLGSQQWIQPYTDEVVQNLKEKNIAVICPSFIVDCLETLEEINIEARKVFTESGGANFYYIPCLNSTDSWITDFGSYLKKKA